MVARRSLADHFSLSNLKPFQEEPILFVVSQWQYNKTVPGRFYLIYRTAVAAFLLATWSMTFSTPSWGIYLTYWGYTLATLQATSGFILSCVTVLSGAFYGNHICDIFLKLYPIYWVLQAMAVPIGFMITSIFWTLLYQTMAPSPLNFFIHGSNSIVLFVDLLIIGHPIRIFHFVYPLIFGICYVVFSVPYYFFDINRGGSGYVYFILDWNKPFQTTLVVLGVGLLLVVLHFLAFIIHKLKLCVYNLIYSKDITSTTNNTHNTEHEATHL